MRIGAALLAVLAAPAYGLAQTDKAVQVFPVGEGAYALYPPELVAQGQIWNFASSRDGRYVAVVRSARQTPPIIGPPPEPKNFELLVYDVATGRSTVRSLPKQMILRNLKLEWAGGGVLFMTVGLVYSVTERPGSRFPVREDSLAVYSPKTGSLTWAVQNERQTKTHWVAYVSPTEPIAVVAWGESTIVGSGEVEASQWLATVGADGRLVNRKKIDPLTHMERDRRWSSDGKTFVSTAFIANMEERTVEDGFLHYEPGTGAIELKTQAEPTWAPQLVDGLGIAVEPNLIERGGHTYQFNTTWVRSDSLPGGFVTEHAGTAKLAQNAGHVAYMAEGALFVKRLKKLSKREYEEYLYELVKSRAMSQAGQVGIALLMYAVDFDHLIPEGLDLHSDLAPYMKSAPLLDGFTYVFHGGNMAEIERITQEILGYVDTEYGRATVYADGHVEWEEK